jgi:hypothetical protein
MAMKMMKFKISGPTVFIVAMLSVLMTSSRNPGLIISISHNILAAVDRIMMWDFISLFMVLCFVGLFGVIVPALTFEVRIGLE